MWILDSEWMSKVSTVHDKLYINLIRWIPDLENVSISVCWWASIFNPNKKQFQKFHCLKRLDFCILYFFRLAITAIIPLSWFELQIISKERPSSIVIMIIYKISFAIRLFHSFHCWLFRCRMRDIWPSRFRSIAISTARLPSI